MADAENQEVILLTGAGGALGRELQMRFQMTAQSVICTSRSAGAGQRLDVTDYARVRDLLDEYRPTHIFHLAAMVSIPEVEENPGAALLTNVLGLQNVLKAVNDLRLAAKVVVASSSEVYGSGQKGVKFLETDPFSPNNFYACTKTAQEEVAQLYIRKGLDVRIARVFNYSSIYKKPIYSLESFASQIAEIARDGKKKEILVGNLSPERDFLQGSDVAAALIYIAERYAHHRIFNICRGETISMHELLDKLIRAFGVDVAVVKDERKYRPLENLYVCGNNERLKELGWLPQYNIDDTVNILARHYKCLYGIQD